VARLLAEPSRRWQLTAWGRDGDSRHVELALAGLRDAAGRVTHFVCAFSDRTELERLRSEVESLKALAAASLGLRADHAGQPARGAQQPCVEISPTDELHADREPGRVL
jgi:hypothetical protein